jgi:hypothetical protein
VPENVDALISQQAEQRTVFAAQPGQGATAAAARLKPEEVQFRLLPGRPKGVGINDLRGGIAAEPWSPLSTGKGLGVRLIIHLR